MSMNFLQEEEEEQEQEVAIAHHVSTAVSRKRPLSSSSSSSLVSTPPSYHDVVMRNVEALYVHPATWNCARQQGGCLVCAYKIACFDVALDKEFTQMWPNQRPETCPRLQKQQQQVAVGPRGIDNKHNNDKVLDDGAPIWPCFRGSSNNNKRKPKVLTVGDGDFSFSVALARHMGTGAATTPDVDGNGGGGGLTATSYESQTRLEQVYSSKMLQSYWKELADAGFKVHFQVDATNLSSLVAAQNNSSDDNSNLPSSSSSSFFWDVVVWNFPCTAVQDGQDGQNQAMEANKALVRKFCESVPAREIHITHKTKPPFDQWDLVQLVTNTSTTSVVPEEQGGQGQQERWTYVGRVVLDRALWPPYVPRKALDQKSFSCHDACTYVFQRKSSSSSAETSSSTSSWLSETLKPVTVDCIKELRDYWMDPRRIAASKAAYQAQQTKRKKSRRRRR